MIFVSQVNVCILQSSLSEDINAAVTENNVKDLACVSVLAVCFDRVTATLLLHNKSKINLELVATNSSKYDRCET